LGFEHPPLAEEPSDGQNAEDVQLSEAETILWMTDQLHRINEPTKFIYHFEKSGTLEEGFTDNVRFSVNEVKDNGMKAASLEFFTGERNVPVPAVEETDVNPVLKVYLQGDVYEMNRLTDEDGEARERWRYFQRRIKYALAEDAVVEPVTINFSGREWAARDVRFKPYVNDPHRGSFEKFAEKEYSIIVCDELPGYLYEIQTTVPGAAPQEPPLIQETLRLVNIEPN
jgi:hypothetical protein